METPANQQKETTEAVLSGAQDICVQNNVSEAFLGGAKEVCAQNNMASPSSSQPNKERSRTQLRWNEKMDEILICVLYDEIMTNGRKADNGLKPESLKRVCVEVNNHQSIPIGPEHCKSRLRTLESDYKKVEDLLKLNGFSINHERHTIDADEAVWLSFLEGHKEYGKIRYKKFPFRKEMAVICGDGHATREETNEPRNSPTPFDLDDTNLDEYATQVPGSSSASTCCRTLSACQKRKRLDFEDQIIEIFDVMAKAAREFSTAFSSAFSKPSFESVVAALDALPDLSSNERDDAYDMFTDKRDLIEPFLAIPADRRVNWLRRRLCSGGHV